MNAPQPGRQRDLQPRPPERVRLVVVDDDADIRLLLVRFARADDRFELVGEATDGIEAAVVVADVRPDVVIMDVRMPHRDGIRAVPYLRAACPNIGIVMYSADHTHAEDALGLRVDAWHTKGDPVAAVLSSAAEAGQRAVPSPRNRRAPQA